MRNMLKTEGVVFCDDEGVNAVFDLLVDEMQKAFSLELSCKPVDTFFVYDCRAQTIQDFMVSDGIFCGRSKPGVGLYSALGISIQAMETGLNYTRMVFIHELTHHLCPCNLGHTATFIYSMDQLLGKYENQTGIKLENDLRY